MLNGGWGAAKALAKFGATPAVVGIVGVGAFGALAAGANSFSVVVIVCLLLGAHVYGQERNRAWLREDKKSEYSRTFDGEGREIIKRVGRRRAENAEREQPTLFPDAKEKSDE